MGADQSDAAARAGIKTVPFCGLPVALLDYALAVELIHRWAEAGDAAYAVEAANAHVVSLSQHEPEFRKAIDRFDLICPDGMPLVWAVNHRVPEEDRLKGRVYGPSLMLRSLESSADTGVRHFFLGGMESTLEKLERRFGDDCPRARIVGSYAPPFGEWPEDEFDRIADKIRSSRANMIWVGLGCPKQEKWIGSHKDKLPPGVYLGVGAAFAFHAGEVKQAPAWMQRIGMEWFYRLLKEPRRLFKRYLVNNCLFIRYWLSDTIRHND